MAHELTVVKDIIRPTERIHCMNVTNRSPNVRYLIFHLRIAAHWIRHFGGLRAEKEDGSCSTIWGALTEGS